MSTLARVIQESEVLQTMANTNRSCHLRCEIDHDESDSCRIAAARRLPHDGRAGMPSLATAPGPSLRAR